MQASEGPVIEFPLCKRHGVIVCHETVTRYNSSRDQPRREQGQVADTAQQGTLDTRPSAKEQVEDHAMPRDPFCDWAM